MLSYPSKRAISPNVLGLCEVRDICGPPKTKSRESCVSCRFIALVLIKPDWITAADCAALQYSSVDTDVSPVVLSRRTQDT